MFGDIGKYYLLNKALAKTFIFNSSARNRYVVYAGMFNSLSLDI